MSEFGEILRRAKRPVGKATAALIAVAALTACNPDAVRAVIKDSAGEKNLPGQELQDRYRAQFQALDMQRILNQTPKQGNVYTGARYYQNFEFRILPDFQQRNDWFSEVCNPIALDGGGIGYTTFESKAPDAKILVHALDASHGKLVYVGPPTLDGRPVDPNTPAVPVMTDLSVVSFDFTPDVANDPQNTMRNLVASDADQTFVGQVCNSAML